MAKFFAVFYEYDYSVPPVGVFNAIHAPDYGLVTTQLTEVTYNDRMLALPDGTILFTDGKTQLYAYQPDGLPLPAGKPAISSVTWNADGSLHVSGTLFNGISQGASFGDDAQMDSNYPLVRFIDGQGNVYYGRTYNWSSTGVQTGSRIVSTEVALPAQVLNFPGDYALEVVANGNASLPVGFSGPVWVDFTVQFDTFQDGSFGHPFYTLAAGLNAVATGGTIAIKSSNSHETPALTKAVTLISVNGPSIIGQ